MSDLFVDVIDWIATRPDWERPVLNGALLVLAWFAARGGLYLYPIVVVLAFLHGSVHEAIALLLLPPIAVAAGALGGLAYSLLLPLRLVGAVGTWLAWVLAVAVYLTPIGLWYQWEANIWLTPPLSGDLIAGALGGLWGGSLGYWTFGRDDYTPSAGHGPTAKGILAEAVKWDLDELADRARTSPEAAQELADVRGHVPSKGLVMHWWRVVGRIGREPPLWKLTQRWALNRAEARLRAAERHWNKVRGLDA